MVTDQPRQKSCGAPGNATFLLPGCAQWQPLQQFPSPLIVPQIMVLKNQMAGGNEVVYVEGKGRILKDLFAEAKLSHRPVLKPWVGCNISLGFRLPANAQEQGLWFSLTLSPRSWMVWGSQIHPVCHMKPDCTQPGPVGGLWDLLCREQGSDMLCHSSEITAHELEL